MSESVPQPRNTTHGGTIRLQVDATDFDHRLLVVDEYLPLQSAGPLVVLYPKWIPGEHAPRGPLQSLMGMSMSADGQPVPWHRDRDDPYAFHVAPPDGARELAIRFTVATPTAADQGRPTITPVMLTVAWSQLILYPAGHYARCIQVRPALRLPMGWLHASALTDAPGKADFATFATTDLETLVDSPVWASRWMRRFELDSSPRSRVTLNVMADRPERLAATPAQLELHQALVQQADRLFGRRPFDHYDFLLAVTDSLGGLGRTSAGAGLEHRSSSENIAAPDYFTDWMRLATTHELLPHEYTHAWNGKFRRPVDDWTPNFNVPMRGSLLWVYEGLTQYWSRVLSARAGLVSKQQALDAIALTAAAMQAQVGRTWRSLADATYDPIVADRRPVPWPTWQRNYDYYLEGELLWLDVDTLIRERSSGHRSLDDFARRFFSAPTDVTRPSLYDRAEIIATLREVQPYDWDAFFRDRVDRPAAEPPLDGLARGGYSLVFEPVSTPFQQSVQYRRKTADFSFSLGLVLKRDGTISAVSWDGPAFTAGLAVGGQVIAVDGTAYDPDILEAAVSDSVQPNHQIELIVKMDDRFRLVRLDYHGGHRYPRLQRIEGRPALLDAILAPLSMAVHADARPRPPQAATDGTSVPAIANCTADRD